ncbi:MAG: hypothetical protein ACLQMF_04590 [Rectinemataceae bacterium]
MTLKRIDHITLTVNCLARVIPTSRRYSIGERHLGRPRISL